MAAAVYLDDAAVVGLSGDLLPNANLCFGSGFVGTLTSSRSWSVFVFGTAGVLGILGVPCILLP